MRIDAVPRVLSKGREVPLIDLRSNVAFIAPLGVIGPLSHAASATATATIAATDTYRFMLPSWRS
jgi:hypothetical protein